MNHLIVLVKKCPELYNPNHADFKNQSKKAKLWTKIAYELALEDGETARSKWRNLRDSYVKYLRNGTILSRASNARYKNWPWAEQMEFMRPYIASKWPELVGRCKIEPSTSEEEGSVVAYDDKGPSEPKRRTRSIKSLTHLGLYDYFLQDSDADDLLFLSYSKTLRTFSKRRQMVVKAKIAKVMLNAEMQQAKEDEYVEVKLEPEEIYERDDNDDDDSREVLNIEAGPSFFILDKDDEFIMTTQE